MSLVLRTITPETTELELISGLVEAKTVRHAIYIARNNNREKKGEVILYSSIRCKVEEIRYKVEEGESLFFPNTKTREE